MRTKFFGGPLDGLDHPFLFKEPTMTFVRNTSNSFIPDNKDPKIASRERYVYVYKDGTYCFSQTKRAVTNKNNSP